MPTILFSSLWTSWSHKVHSAQEVPQYADTQTWINLCLQAKLTPYNHSSFTHSPACSSPSSTCQIFVNDPPPFLTFEIAPDTVPLHIPSRTFHMSSSTSGSSFDHEYHLRAIIYHGDYHFTARLFDQFDGIWTYDGQKNEGFPSPEFTWSECDNFHKLTSLEGRNGHIYLYAL
jgi:hypothetical protein